MREGIAGSRRLRLSIHAHRWTESGNVQGIATVLKNMYPECLISWGGRIRTAHASIARRIASSRSRTRCERAKLLVQCEHASGGAADGEHALARVEVRVDGEARGPIERQLELVCREDEVLGAGLQRAASRPGHSAVAHDLQAPGANPKHPSHLGLIAYRDSRHAKMDRAARRDLLPQR